VNDLRKAAEMALEALEHFNQGNSTAAVQGEFNDEIEALRQALAHEALDRMVAENQRLGLYDDAMDKQGPVAYRCWNNHKNADGTFDTLRIWASLKPEGYGNEPLYTAPQKREWVDELRGNDTPEVTPDVDNAYTKLDTSDRVLHTTNVPQP